MKITSKGLKALSIALGASLLASTMTVNANAQSFDPNADPFRGHKVWVGKDFHNTEPFLVCTSREYDNCRIFPYQTSLRIAEVYKEGVLVWMVAFGAKRMAYIPRKLKTPIVEYAE